MIAFLSSKRCAWPVDTAARLAAAQINTVSQLMAANEDRLRQLFRHDLPEEVAVLNLLLQLKIDPVQTEAELHFLQALEAGGVSHGTAIIGRLRPLGIAALATFKAVDAVVISQLFPEAALDPTSAAILAVLLELHAEGPAAPAAGSTLCD